MRTWKVILIILVVSAVLGGVVVGVANYLNREDISACEELGGEVTPRGFNCTLPTGEIVKPVKYLESLE